MLVFQSDVLNVLFENLDILNKKPLSLNTEDLYKRVVLSMGILYRFEAPLNKWTIDSIYQMFVLTETSPQSIFNKNYFLFKVTEEGRITLLGDTLIIVKGKELIKEKLANHEIVEEAQRYFQLSI